MKRWIGLWFAQVWSQSQLRLRVAGEYAAIRSSRHMLADIAMRNGVFAPGPDANNLFQAGIAEGRKRAALEILDMARVDPADLMDVTVRLAPRETEAPRGSARPAYLEGRGETS